MGSGTCTGSESILFGWARDAPALQLPKGLVYKMFTIIYGKNVPEPFEVGARLQIESKHIIIHNLCPFTVMHPPLLEKE